MLSRRAGLSATAELGFLVLQCDALQSAVMLMLWTSRPSVRLLCLSAMLPVYLDHIVLIFFKK